MAKITINIDTDVQGISADIDGTTIDGVAYVSVSQYNDEKPYVCIEVPQKLDNGLRSMLRLSTGSETKIEYNKPDDLSLKDSIASFLN